MFSARLIRHKDSNMLNICDTDLLGRTVNRDGFSLKINEEYYGQKVVEKEEAKDLLKQSDNINMVGKDIIDLSVNLGIGSEEGVKVIDGIPFLIVFKM